MAFFRKGSKKGASFLLLALLLMSCSTFFAPSLADPRIAQAALICTNHTASAAARSPFIANFLSAMDAVTPQISARQYARVVVTGGTDPPNASSVYAFGQCLRDLSKSDCDLCFATCKTQILRCLPFQKTTRGGRNFLDGCYLRYDDYQFFGEAQSQYDRVVCSEQEYTGNATSFSANARKLIRNLTDEAPRNNGFLVGSVEGGNSTVYGLGQCWEFVNRTSCQTCLLAARMAIHSCIPRQEGRVLNSGCYLRYATTRFYDNSTNDAAEGGGRHIAVILAVLSSVLASVMILSAVIFILRGKIIKRRKERKQLGALAPTVRKSNLNFKYETLEKATNFFSNDNKLGQGGSGSVFKGVLPDGRRVAVKRLYYNTRQWVDHFFNEVNLISGIEHKNLVKLLGCSITGPESLLVYEYVPNKSLDHYLSDDANARLLSWSIRYNIILGTAEGLTYLHQESQLRIIHRDIKLSNILLDEEYAAKIADFGLVRLFPEDKTHISTGVVGTLGYMAPEYVVQGKLTEKVDVFSFGVFLVEIMTGRKTSFQSQDTVSALQMVWSLYTSDRLLEAMDPILQGNFPTEKASRALQIGLLCAQASAELRPMMSSVVKMLKDDSPIPSPTQPPFLSSSIRRGLAAQMKVNSRNGTSTQSSENSTTMTVIEPR
ncbi:cysteine-rich receptor-like protein kinase 3 [Zingiber officinale]|uniref:cysteine-rich receptor-like protein kinase 3 n=1 Tax=Zingiber officinale TaxID=94328 RepID=UPI001C4B3895|nr:cysteine-rich receptor-like protein kinase 3 [Zingiber officinale]